MAAPRSGISIALTGPMENVKPNRNNDKSKPAGHADALASRLAVATSADARGSNNNTTANKPGNKPVPVGNRRPLPTPPNSISPTIPPAVITATRYGGTSAPAHATDELDTEHLDLRDTSALSASPFESSGSITSALLAKHHLPDILLTNGPLAIRHIMGYLTTSVPGFSSVSPAKARRLVVGALEGKGGGGEGGGVRGEVKFDKVGWGRWDARLRGQAPRANRDQHPPSPALPGYPTGMPITNTSNMREGARRPQAPSSSWTGEFSHDGDKDKVEEEEEMDMEMEDMDRMSLDDPCSSSEAPSDLDHDDVMRDDPEDLTDEENWEAVGAKALREASYQDSAPLGSWGGGAAKRHVYTGGSASYSYGHGGTTYGSLGTSLGKRQTVPVRPVAGKSGLSGLGGLSAEGRPQNEVKRQKSFMPASADEERNAIEALLKLSASPAV